MWTLKSSEVHIVALESQGAESFYHSVLSTESPSHTLPAGVTSAVSSQHGVTVATLSAVTTLATSLAASSSASGVVKMAVDRRANGRGGPTCVTVPDELSMSAALEFAGKSNHVLLSESRFRSNWTFLQTSINFSLNWHPPRRSHLYILPLFSIVYLVTL